MMHSLRTITRAFLRFLLRCCAIPPPQSRNTRVPL